MTAERPGSAAETPVPDPDGRDGGIDAILADVVPALAARLRGSRLAELEVRTADWRVRVRREAASDRSSPVPGPAKPSPVRAGGASSAVDQGHAGMARSPAVGYFQPSASAEMGRSVRSGDLLGHVEMLGVQHDVTAPTDGVVIRSLAAAGQAVEFGQPLVQVEPGGSIALAVPALSDPGTG